MKDRAKGFMPQEYSTLVEKCPTSIRGFDDISGGGLPRGRTTLIYGGPGSGKTIFGLEFLVRGARHYNEPAIMICFGENEAEFYQNYSSFNWDLAQLQIEDKIHVSYLFINRDDITKSNTYDLGGFFVLVKNAVERLGAKRLLIDSIDPLLTGVLDNPGVRPELYRFFGHLKGLGVTSVFTSERHERVGNMDDVEQYLSDCVILLSRKMNEQTSTRRLRILKYRGSCHATNEHLFFIDRDGFNVFAVKSLCHELPTDHISSGIEMLDNMLDGRGFYRASSILITGSSGTGKTSFAASFVDSACQRGNRCLFLSFNELHCQIARDMHSIGMDLEGHVKSGLLKFYTSRPSLDGPEMTLTVICNTIESFKPAVVVLDSISFFTSRTTSKDVSSLFASLIDYIREYNITTLCTDHAPDDENCGQTDSGISALMDIWIVLRDLQPDGEVKRTLRIVKSRGMNHARQPVEFTIGNQGIQLDD
ncbi:MAG: circadian clock protein KaiC [Candidatus Magnetobacterium sp. LHC-1]